MADAIKNVIAECDKIAQGAGLRKADARVKRKSNYTGTYEISLDTLDIGERDSVCMDMAEFTVSLLVMVSSGMSRNASNEKCNDIKQKLIHEIAHTDIPSGCVDFGYPLAVTETDFSDNGAEFSVLIGGIISVKKG